MSVGTGSIRRVADKVTEQPAPQKVETKPSTNAVKTSAKKSDVAKKRTTAKKTTKVKTQADTVKSAVLTGANPDVEFYHISDDLPIYLL